jgi:hypothetical protein
MMTYLKAWRCAGCVTGPSTRGCWGCRPNICCCCRKKAAIRMAGRIAQNMAGYLLTLEQRSIIGPEELALWPHGEALHWHRLDVFRRG